MSHAVDLSTSFASAWALFSSPEQLPRLQHALDGCTHCTVIAASPAAPAAAQPLGAPTEAQLVAALASSSRPDPDVLDGLDWPALTSEERGATRFAFELAPFGVRVEGAQTVVLLAPGRGAVLFHSHVRSAGIEERKLRVVEAVRGGGTRVAEAVWGTAPRVVAWGLRTSGVAARTHRLHMDAYAGLLRDEPAESGPRS